MKAIATHLSPRARAAFSACCVAALAILFVPNDARATTCDPVIGLTTDFQPPYLPAPPSQTITLEVPHDRPIAMALYVLNLGCVPLDWRVRDVNPGTNVDSDWLTESPDSGTVQPADTQPGHELVSVLMNPLPPGLYMTVLIFNSNDSERPAVSMNLVVRSVGPVSTRRHALGELKARYRTP